MKILYLAHRIPYPPNKGDKIRSFHEIRVLSKTYEIHLACLADDPKDLEYEKELQKLCKRIALVPLNKTWSKLKGALSLLTGRPLSVGYFHSETLQQTVTHWLSTENYDAIICFSSPMAEYLFKGPSQTDRCNSKLPTSSTNPTPPLLVMDFCDVDSDKWAQYARETRIPASLLYKLESRRLLEYEKLVNQSFDHSLFVSKPEAYLFKELVPDARNVHTISNGVDYNYFSPESVPSETPVKLKKPALVFTGAMDYHANVDGVVWFASEVFPGIRARHPEAAFYIVGSKPAPQVQELARQPGIHVTGFVDDIRPYYSQADVCVIPLRLARGVQNKVLEAMSMARPVVATSRANQGILADHGTHLLVEDTAHGFQDAVLSLLSDSPSAETLGRRARDYIHTKYDWVTNMTGLAQLLASATPS